MTLAPWAFVGRVNVVPGVWGALCAPGSPSLRGSLVTTYERTLQQRANPASVSPLKSQGRVCHQSSGIMQSSHAGQNIVAQLSKIQSVNPTSHPENSSNALSVSSSKCICPIQTTPQKGRGELQVQVHAPAPARHPSAVVPPCEYPTTES